MFVDMRMGAAVIHAQGKAGDTFAVEHFMDDAMFFECIEGAVKRYPVGLSPNLLFQVGMRNGMLGGIHYFEQ